MSDTTARAQALQILQRIETQNAYADRLLQTAAQRSALDGRDQALLHQLVKGTLEWRGKLDAVLAPFVRDGLSSLTPWIRNILRLGAYQILFLDRIPPEVAVHESVELAKRYGHRGTVGLVNAVLRKVAARAPQLRAASDTGQSATALATNYSHPEWLVERWLDQLGAQETIALLEANNRPWPICLRTNPLRATTTALQEQLRAEGVLYAPAHFLDDCTLIERLPSDRRLHELASYRQGLFQVQDESSVLVGLLVDPQPGEFVLDLCSAPGGKTTHMAALMRNEGRLLAADLHLNRLGIVMSNCERLGVQIVESLSADGRTLHLDAPADRVLVDAPCSGLGVLGRKSDARWNKLAAQIEQLTVLQGELLRHAATLVRPGGRLVYSTCTLEPAENEGVVAAFLAEHPHYRLLPPPASIPPALVNEQGFYYAWPQRHQIGGAFGAILQRFA